MEYLNQPIQFRQISDAFHEYHIPNLHDNVIKYKDRIIKESRPVKNSDEYNPNPPDHQVVNRLISQDIDDEFQKIFHTILNQFYIVGPSWSHFVCGVYIQNNKDGVYEYHSHVKQNSLTGLFYIDPPKQDEGGELEIWDLPDAPLKIQPEKDSVYFFPSWLVHRPLPQTSPTTRISINWGYVCDNRPVHRLTGDRW